MPIDTGRGHDLIPLWLPAFITAMSMNPTHPLRKKTVEDAEKVVRDSYASLEITEEPSGLSRVSATTLRHCADDVIEMLWAFAYLAVESEHDGERVTELKWSA